MSFNGLAKHERKFENIKTGNVVPSVRQLHSQWLTGKLVPEISSLHRQILNTTSFHTPVCKQVHLSFQLRWPYCRADRCGYLVTWLPVTVVLSVVPEGGQCYHFLVTKHVTTGFNWTAFKGMCLVRCSWDSNSGAPALEGDILPVNCQSRYCNIHITLQFTINI